MTIFLASISGQRVLSRARPPNGELRGSELAKLSGAVVYDASMQASCPSSQPFEQQIPPQTESEKGDEHTYSDAACLSHQSWLDEKTPPGFDTPTRLRTPPSN